MSGLFCLVFISRPCNQRLYLYGPRHEKTAKLISAFVFATWIVQSLYFLNPKFRVSSHLLWLYSPVCIGPGRKPRRPVFSQRGSYCGSLCCMFMVLVLHMRKKNKDLQCQISGCSYYRDHTCFFMHTHLPWLTGTRSKIFNEIVLKDNHLLNNDT